jgi:putative sterol carrier protein
MAGFATKEEMEPVVKRWLEKVKTDENLAKLCKEMDVRMGFYIYELDLRFYVNFLDGSVDGGMGLSDPPSTVSLEMTSEIFDGMFTGEVDAASATMTGEMTFSGDMNAAMGLQVLGDDMAKTWLEAKAEVPA